MTEEEWMACDDAVEMMLPRRPITDDSRKLALFAIAVWWILSLVCPRLV